MHMSKTTNSANCWKTSELTFLTWYLKETIKIMINKVVEQHQSRAKRYHADDNAKNKSYLIYRDFLSCNFIKQKEKKKNQLVRIIYTYSSCQILLYQSKWSYIVIRVKNLTTLFLKLSKWQRISVDVQYIL